MSTLSIRVAASTSRAVRAASRTCRIQSRAIHQRKQLSYPVEEGLGSFLPPHSLKMIAEDYQQGLLDRLNDQIRGTSLENRSIVQTIIDAARDPNKVLEFNYASEALNNSFFLENLKPPPADASTHEAALFRSAEQTRLLRRIRYDYGSLAHFKSNFSAAALGLFSSGYIWLVTDQNGQLGVIPTFGAGTLLVRSSRQSPALEAWKQLVGEPIVQVFAEDGLTPASPSAPPPAPSSPVSGVSRGVPGLEPQGQVRSMSTSSWSLPRGTYDHDVDKTLNATERDGQKTGDILFPLFCVSVHERAWVSAGYGVWGKEEYMKRFWSVVDWDKAVKVYEKVVPARNRHQ